MLAVVHIISATSLFSLLQTQLIPQHYSVGDFQSDFSQLCNQTCSPLSDKVKVATGRVLNINVSFTTPFALIPQVQVYITSYKDYASVARIRLTINQSQVTQQQFTVSVGTWSFNQLEGLTIQWIATTNQKITLMDFVVLQNQDIQNNIITFTKLFKIQPAVQLFIHTLDSGGGLNITYSNNISSTKISIQTPPYQYDLGITLVIVDLYGEDNNQLIFEIYNFTAVVISSNQSFNQNIYIKNLPQDKSPQILVGYQGIGSFQPNVFMLITLPNLTLNFTTIGINSNYVITYGSITKLSCNQNSFQKINSSNNQIQCICTNGFYPDYSQQICLTCQKDCLECNDSVNCSSCISLQRNVINGKCICLDGFYDDQIYTICQPCDQYCQICAGRMACQLCEPNWTLNNGSCQCEEIGKFITSDTNNCQNCKILCKTCDNPTTCDSCYPLMNRMLDPTVTITSGNCTCIEGFYDDQVDTICQPCDSNCLICVGYKDCQQCAHNWTSINGSCQYDETEQQQYSQFQQLYNIVNKSYSELKNSSSVSGTIINIGVPIGIFNFISRSPQFILTQMFLDYEQTGIIFQIHRLLTVFNFPTTIGDCQGDFNQTNLTSLFSNQQFSDDAYDQPYQKRFRLIGISQMTVYTTTAQYMAILFLLALWLISNKFVKNQSYSSLINRILKFLLHSIVEGNFLFFVSSQLVTLYFLNVTILNHHVLSIISLLCSLTFLASYTYYLFIVIKRINHFHIIKGRLQLLEEQNRPQILQLEQEILQQNYFYLVLVRTDNLSTSLYTLMNQVKKLLICCILVFGVQNTLMQLILMEAIYIFNIAYLVLIRPHRRRLQQQNVIYIYRYGYIDSILQSLFSIQISCSLYDYKQSLTTQASNRNGFTLAYVVITILAFDSLKFVIKNGINLHYFYNMWREKNRLKKLTNLIESTSIIDQGQEVQNIELGQRNMPHESEEVLIDPYYQDHLLVLSQSQRDLFILMIDDIPGIQI